MALVKLSALVDNISGRVGSLVFSRTKGGLAVRQYNRWGPGDGPWMDDTRDILTSVSYRWWRMTDTQRKAWGLAAPNFPYQNRLGDKQVYSGYTLYTKLNWWRYYIGLEVNFDPPKPPIEAKISNLRISQLTVAKFTIRGDIEITDKRVYQIIKVSHPMEVGLMRPPNMFLLTHIRRTASGSFRIDLEDLYSSRFPTIQTPKKVFIESFLLDEYSGVTYGHRILSKILT